MGDSEMRILSKEIRLAAPAERVWELLSDLVLYPQWNPLFVKGEGTLSPNEGVELVVQLPNMAPFTIQPKVLTVEPHSTLSWQHKIISKGLLSWTYCYRLDPISCDRVRFIQTSQFDGCLGPLFNFALTVSLNEGMEQMGQAVKQWGEKGTSAV